MPSCLSIWEVHFGYVCMIQLWIRTTIVTCSMTDDFMSLDFCPVMHPMPILGHIFRFGWDLRTFLEVTCAMMDDFMTFVLQTCRAPDAILGHIPFRRIFMDLRRGHMFDDRWFHAIWSPTYHTFRCHTGAYFGSDEIYRSWGSRVLILIWRDVCRDDIFAILTMIP